MDLAEDMIKYIITYVMEHCPDEMDFFNSFVDKGLKERLQHVATSDFGRVSYTEAIEILEKSGHKFDYPVSWGVDLQTEHERFLTEQHFKKPVFVTDYPKDIKAFYMRMNDDGKTVAAVDLLVPGIGVIIGGSSARSGWICWSAAFRSWAWIPTPTSITATCAAMAAAATRLRPGLRAHGHVPDRRQQHPRRSAPPQNGWKCGFF